MSGKTKAQLNDSLVALQGEKDRLAARLAVCDGEIRFHSNKAASLSRKNDDLIGGVNGIKTAIVSIGAVLYPNVVFSSSNVHDGLYFQTETLDDPPRVPEHGELILQHILSLVDDILKRQKA